MQGECLFKKGVSFFLYRKVPWVFMVVACGVLFSAMPLPQNAVAADGDLKKVRLSIVAFLGDATMFYAYRKGLFAEEGLDIELVRYKAGARSLRAVVEGEIDIGAVAPTPIVYTAMGRTGFKPDFRVFASILNSTHLNNLVVLDRNKIRNVQDLSGKRLALQKGTASEFFWHRMALANHLDTGKVTIVDIPTPDIPEKAKEDLFDAAVAWTPYHLSLIKNTSTPVEVYSGENFYTTSWLAIAKPAFIKENPDIIDGFLRALKRAQDQLFENPISVAAVQSELGNASPAELVENYKTVTFSLGLTESLLVNLAQQGSWALQKGYVTEPVPDFHDYLDLAPLMRVAPESVLLLQ